MNEYKKIKVMDGSITPSTLLLNQLINDIPSDGMLTPEQITLLRRSKKEISQQVQITLAQLRSKD